jgi:D-glycero-alpha-D-manno-heptose-7-phosphate kinase
MPRYPDAVVTPLPVTTAVCAALDARLLHLYLGRSHESWAVHRAVIASLAGGGTAADRLEPLRALAREGGRALAAGDLEAYGRALTANTAAQAALHPALIGESASRVIALARAYGASGWKVNGAGGDGGSVTVLCGPAPGARATLAAALEAVRPAVRVLPLTLAGRGVHLVEPA